MLMVVPLKPVLDIFFFNKTMDKSRYLL